MFVCSYGLPCTGLHNLLVGGVVAIGQEPSTLPDAPSAS